MWGSALFKSPQRRKVRKYWKIFHKMSCESCKTFHTCVNTDHFIYMNTAIEIYGPVLVLSKIVHIPICLLTFGQYCPIIPSVRGNEFIRKIKKLGRKNNIPVRFVTRRGKGSHGTLFYGRHFTIVRNSKDELKTGTVQAMLDQLGLVLDDLKDI